MYYILDENKNIIKVSNVTEWAKWFEDINNRIVKKDKIEEIEISTVFLGIDHSFGQGLSILFETMIFGGTLDGDQWRYSTFEEAEKGHKEAVELVKAKIQFNNPQD